MSWDKKEGDENETGNENENENFWSRRKKRRAPGGDFNDFSAVTLIESLKRCVGTWINCLKM